MTSRNRSIAEHRLNMFRAEQRRYTHSLYCAKQPFTQHADCESKKKYGARAPAPRSTTLPEKTATQNQVPSNKSKGNFCSLLLRRRHPRLSRPQHGAQMRMTVLEASCSARKSTPLPPKTPHGGSWCSKCSAKYFTSASNHERLLPMETVPRL